MTSAPDPHQSASGFSCGMIGSPVGRTNLPVRSRIVLVVCQLVAVLALTASVPAASAAGAFYLGKWKIVSAAVAPWADNRTRRPDATEMKSLVGRTITIEPKAIRGPHALACTDPRYEVKEYPADMLFQGAFGEMHERDVSADPAKIAEKVGFRGSRWKTLETGCAVEIDYHFINLTTAAFGLNDYVYTLTKQP
jgi:hypothetical protein